MPKITLFSSYFSSPTPERQEELDYCFNENLQNPNIDQLVIMIDDDSKLPKTSSKVKIIKCKNRPTYKDWLKFSEKISQDTISILANSDIYFDDSIVKIQEAMEEPSTFLALSRWEVEGETLTLHKNPKWSQDVWAIRGGTKFNANFLRQTNFPMGVPRCDNKIAYCFSIYGHKIINPCNFIKSMHVHETQIRSYNKKTDDTIIGGVAYVNESPNLSSQSSIEIDVYAKNTHRIESVSLNRHFDEAVEAVEAVEILTNYNDIFTIGEIDGELIVFDKARKHKLSIPKPDNLDFEELMHYWIPPVLKLKDHQISDKPIDDTDINFWQYPCATEEQAYNTHGALEWGSNIDRENGIAHVYMGLPWATYIDKKKLPDKFISRMRNYMFDLRTLSNMCGLELKVHSVCQQIHWTRLIETYQHIGITDLHISHMEETSADLAGENLTIHSWPLMAVNFESQGRSEGLVTKTIAKKKFFASFKGAHMPHYRSDIRERIVKVMKEDASDDVFCELNTKWHFNDIVYVEQVKNQILAVDDVLNEKKKTKAYNELLSDSVFSICPEGAGPNTLRLWESMSVGSIPVVFADGWIPPECPDPNISFLDCVVQIPHSEVDGFLNTLRKMSKKKIAAKRSACLKAYKAYRQMVGFGLEAPEPKPSSDKKPSPVIKKAAKPPAATTSDFIDAVILIDGIGPKSAETLAKAGITRLTQIATMPVADITMIEEKLGKIGIVAKQEWVKQANEMIGGAEPRSQADKNRAKKMRSKASKS